MAASVSTTHPSYDKHRFSWRTVRDCVEGESAIKRADMVYLPMPSAMLQNAAAENPNAISFAGGAVTNNRRERLDENEDYFQEYDPSTHSNAAYASYKKRAHFPLITSNILRGLKGVATSKKPTFELPSQLEYFEDDTTRDGKCLIGTYEWALGEALTVGRGFMLVDVDARTSSLYTSLYRAEDIINWRVEKVDGQLQVKFIVLREHVTDNEDEFSHDLIERHRVLKIVDGKYQVDTYLDGDFVGTISPRFKGKELDYIPGVFVGSSDQSICIDEIPMYGIARCAVQIYMKNADMSQAEFMSCNPTLFISGVDQEGMPKAIGSTVVVGLENPDAKAWYPQTDTSALQHVSLHIDKLFDEAMQYGMSLLGGGKKMAESAEALRLRQSASGASLKTIVNSVGLSMKKMLMIAADWSGADVNSVDFGPNTEFANVVLTASERQAMLQAWMGGAISWDTYMENMRRAGTVDPNVTNEEELIRLQTNPPPVAAVNAPPVGNDAAVGNVTKTVGKEGTPDEVNAGRQDS